MIAVVAALTFLAFAPSLQNGFVNWDDDRNFINNPYFRGFAWPNLAWMLGRFHMGHYQPLTWLTLALDYTLWGMNPLGYHLTNIVLHAAAAGLFARMLLRLSEERNSRLRSPASAPNEVRRQRVGDFVLIGAAALLWSLHPLRVEAVSWVTERREVLCGVLTLLTLDHHVRGADRGEPLCSACWPCRPRRRPSCCRYCSCCTTCTRGAASPGPSSPA